MKIYCGSNPNKQAYCTCILYFYCLRPCCYRSSHYLFLCLILSGFWLLKIHYRTEMRQTMKILLLTVIKRYTTIPRMFFYKSYNHSIWGKMKCFLKMLESFRKISLTININFFEVFLTECNVNSRSSSIMNIISSKNVTLNSPDIF